MTLQDDSFTSTTSQVEDASPILSADEWIQQGERVLFDPTRRRIVSESNEKTVHVWKRIVAPYETTSQSRWLTLISGPPEGTYGFSKVDRYLQTAPRLYVEYVGLGDSDKPSGYDHSITDQANLVEAHWRAQKIRRTVLICHSGSSMVMMELLQRQREKLSLGLPVRTRIEHVLCINGGFYAHTHTPHPLNACPIVKNTVGKAVMKTAQHSDAILEPLVQGCFSKEYNLTKEELHEIGKVVRNRKGLRYFTSKASKYIEDHKKHGDRLNLTSVYQLTRKQRITFTIIGGEYDRFEFKSYALAKEQLAGQKDIYFEMIPSGGYCLSLEFPRRIAALMDGVAMAPAFDPQLYDPISKRSSMNTAASDQSTLSTGHSSISGGEGWADAEFDLEEYSF